MVKNKPLNALSPFSDHGRYLPSGTVIEVGLTGERMVILMPCEHMPKDPAPEITGQKYLARTTTNSKTPITECEFKVVYAPDNLRESELIKPGTVVRVNLTEELVAVLAPCPHEDSDPEFQFTGQKYLVRMSNKKKRTVMACEISVPTFSDTPTTSSTNVLVRPRPSL